MRRPKARRFVTIDFFHHHPPKEHVMQTDTIESIAAQHPVVSSDRWLAERKR